MLKTELLRLDGVKKTYITGGMKKQVLDGLSLTVGEGEIVALLGPSGCGKTTVLNLAAGFDNQYEGAIRFQGQPVLSSSPERGVVFQSPQLFGWLTVKKNIAFGLKQKKLPDDRIRQLTQRILEEVQLTGFGDAYPHQLSGGMAQRAALARCFVMEPALLLMDEPFSALDAQLRYRMQQLLLNIWAETQPGVLFITHDIEEALLLAHRIYVMGAPPSRIIEEISVPFVGQQGSSLLREPKFFEMKAEILEKMAALF